MFLVENTIVLIFKAVWVRVSAAWPSENFTILPRKSEKSFLIRDKILNNSLFSRINFIFKKVYAERSEAWEKF